MAEPGESRLEFLREWDETRILPVVVVCRADSELAQAIWHEIEILLPERVKEAWIPVGDAAMVPETLERCRGASFRSGLDHPLWEHEPPWCIILDEEGSDQAVLENERCRLIQLIDAKNGVDLSCTSGPNGIVYAVDSTQCMLSNLVDAISAYLLGGWRRYCHKRDGNLGEAFMLPSSATGKAYSLGIGIMENGAGRHAPRWHHRLMRGIYDRMTRNAPSQGQAKEMPLRDLVQFLIPPEGYSVQQGANPTTGHEIVCGPTSVHLVDRSARLFVDVDRLTKREEVIRVVTKLRDRRAALHVVTQPGVEAFCRSRTEALEDSIKAELSEALRPSPEIDGILAGVGKKLKYCSDRTRYLQGLESRGDKDRKPSSVQYRDLIRKLAAIPSSWGLCARVALVSIGLAWITLAGMIWAEGWKFWGDATIRSVSYISGFAIVVLFAAAASYYWYANFRACKALSDAEEEAITEHLDHISGEVKSHLNRLGGALVEVVGKPESHADDTWFSRWHEILSAVETEFQRWNAVESKLNAGGEFFSEQTIDRLVASKEDHMIQRVWECLYEKLCSDLPESLLDSNSYTSWIEGQVKDVVGRVFESLTINELLDFEKPDRSREERWLHDLVEAAKHPHLKTDWAFHGSRMLVVAPDSWSDRRGIHTELEVVDLRTRRPIVVAAHPLKTKSH